MLYIASVLSGNDNIYPIGFMIATGNEDKKNWTKMLRCLKEAFPIISEQRPHPFVFVSDRDKGLKPALQEVFPDNCETSCAYHIQANVKQKFGDSCSRHVMAMAKSYSLRYYNEVLDTIRQLKPRAAEYVENITTSGVVWSNSQWTDSERALPPRFGIVTSNTSESVNSMFNAARDLPWMDALEKMVDIMLTRISTLRTKYVKHEDSAVVPPAHQLLKRRWDATASISVIELEDGNGIFRTSTAHIGSVELEQGLEVQTWRPRDHGLPLQRQTSHIVKPQTNWCSCGVWQDTLLPCSHACAVYRKNHGADLNYILANLVHDYYTYGFLKRMFKNNIYPVSLDNLAYDGVTKPPFVSKRSTGRPRKLRRIRRRSEYASEADSPIICSTCGLRGHNRRTCSRRLQPGTIDDDLTPVETNLYL
jgi:hypothetical protein